MNFLKKDVDFEVYKYCKAKGINCSWDFDRKQNLMWTEIIVGSRMVMQIDSSATVLNFKNLVRALQKNFHIEDTPDDGDYWFALESERDFKNFILKHGYLFN